MSDLPVPSTTVRFTFNTPLAAASALLAVLEDARVSERAYRFTGLSFTQILKSGITLEGDVTDIVRRVARIDGAVQWDA